MSDTPERGHELSAPPAMDVRGRRRHRLLLAAGVVAAALLGGGIAGLLTGPTARTPTAASPTATAPPAAPSTGATVAPAGPTNPPSPSPSPSPSSSAAAVPGLVEVSGDAVWFRTPSGNIGCQMTSASASCDLLERSWEPPPRPADCELDYGQGVFVDGDRSGLTCAGDTQFVPDAPVLAYGTGWVLGAVRCTSAEDGVTCVNTATSRGFLVSRDRLELR